MRVLMLNQLFQPEPAFKGLPLARALRGLGHEVQVLTGLPNYPGGKIYPGYRVRLTQREWFDGIAVHRVIHYPSHDRSGLRRMINYLSFAASAALLGPGVVKPPDVIYVYNLITLSAAARRWRARWGTKIVLDVQDLWPESVLGSGMMRSRLLAELLRRWCLHEYRCADALVVLSPGFRRNLIDRGIAAKKIDVIYNWCDETAIRVPPPRVPSAEFPPDRFHVVFAGVMGVSQSLDVVIETAARLLTDAPQVLFTLVGGGTEPPRLEQLAQSMGLSNVRFLPQRPMSAMGEVFAAADALLVHLRDDPLFAITIPSKVQVYLHAGRPILCGVRGDAAELVERAGAGVCFPPNNAEALAAAVMNMLAMSAEERQQMGQRGRQFYEEQLSFRQGVSQLEAVFRRVAPGRKRQGDRAA